MAEEISEKVPRSSEVQMREDEASPINEKKMLEEERKAQDSVQKLTNARQKREISNQTYKERSKDLEGLIYNVGRSCEN